MIPLFSLPPKHRNCGFVFRLVCSTRFRCQSDSFFRPLAKESGPCDIPLNCFHLRGTFSSTRRAELPRKPPRHQGNSRPHSATSIWLVRLSIVPYPSPLLYVSAAAFM